MNKVITINLGGTAYQLEEGGYDALRAYLETATARLQGNPDRDEILLDIERAIAEKFRALLASHKTVVGTKEVAVVLMDVHMPVLDGFEATARIREMERSKGTHTPLIALTANAMDGDRERCLRAGMDGYISKPVRRDELLDTIAQFAPKKLLTT